MDKQFFVKVAIGDDFSSPSVYPIYPPTDEFGVVLTYAHAELYIQGIPLESRDDFHIVSRVGETEVIEFDSSKCL